jgi:phage baseplate assembly protein V
LAYRRGIVTELDGAKHRLRCEFVDKQGLVSPWLEVLVRGAHQDKDVGMPAVGDQVAVMLDEKEESGCVLGCLYSDADPVPETATATTLRRIEFSDGCILEYDRETHVLRVELPEGGVVQLAGDVEPIALGDKVRAELDAIQSALDSHTHQAGALVSPPGTSGGPVTGTTGTASSGYSPGDVGAAQVRSA